MSQQCAGCKDKVFAMDEKVAVTAGVFHRKCFKCRECGCQLTLLNMASVKGGLYCKAHYVELFKRRGKYDDFEDATVAGGAGGTESPVKPPSGGESSPAPPSPTPSPAPASRSPSPAPVPAPAALTEVPAEEASVDTRMARMSVRERIALVNRGQSGSVTAPPTSAPAPAPSPAPAAPAPAPVAVPVPVPVAVVDAPAPAPAPAPVAVAAPAPVVAAAAAAPVAAPSSEASSSGVGEGNRRASVRLSALGGGGSKCTSCGKSVYAADPSVSADGQTFHRECFKCAHCKGQLTLKTMAAINGKLYCKPHYVALFKLKGRYDSLMEGGEDAALPGVEEVESAAAEGAGGEAAAAVVARDVPVTA